MMTPYFGYRGRVLGIVAGLLASSAFVAPTLSSPEERSVWSGVFTTHQAERGREAYAESCASCHRADLSGRGPIPALAGESFIDPRYGTTVGDLFTRIRSTMPPSRPNSLTPEVYADLVAYLLSENDFPPGSTELPGHVETLSTIVFDDGVTAVGS